MELKFRAWSEKLKWMSKPFEIGGYLNFHNQVMMPLTKDEIVMQFTGLQDKNKKDICEGDIIEYRNELGKHSVHKVFRVAGGLVINSHSDDFHKEYTPFYEACADMQTSGWIKQCEVIGNIYENPNRNETHSNF